MNTVIKVGIIAALIQTSVLTAGLAMANTPISGLAVIELAVAMLWISLVVNVAFIAGLTLSWFPLKKLMGWTRADWSAYLISGLAGLHLTWTLLNRLTLAQTWIRPPRFLTWSGLLQCVMLCIVAIGLIIGGVCLRNLKRRQWAAPVLVLSVVMAAGCLVWNARTEILDRTYTLEEIRHATPASWESQLTEKESGEHVPVVVLGLDGLSWSVMKPLLAAGKLPNFARLIEYGAIGYLDNGDISYSPLIWNTIFSGRTAHEHGINGFRKLVLPFSGHTVSDFLMMVPTLHSFYGITHLVERMPNPGLWRMESVNSTDRKVKTLWDVASGFDKRVVVANTLTSLPVQPVNGQMIVYRRNADPLTAFPQDLAKQWADAMARSGIDGGGWRTHVDDPRPIMERARLEADFTLELLCREDFDLGVYYDKLVDEMSHLGWNFYGKDQAILSDLPRKLDNEEWEQLVLEYAADPVFESYSLLDANIGAYLERLNANFVIVSDHGWTYSGFEHYGSQDGIVILSGPAFRRGINLSGAHIADITPTVLSVLGIPLSKKLNGRPLLDTLKKPPNLASIDSYGKPRYPRKPPTGMTDEEQLRRLKALGYIQ